MESIAACRRVRSNTTPGRRSSSPVEAIGPVTESSPVMRSVSTSTGGPSVMRNVTRTLLSAFATTLVSTAAE
jgi:hypothetical protein